ncbi:pilus assembly protein [Bombiscardovia nodaiensis]|uniref:Pilus assembly protein n=1 Tax=Bombiscardovia nodaiensis TaxID=2932181 RepID=A0ABM8BA50_9BIFI|nr:pilus assembly protein [Bombiscardovia nodaiensis]
MNEGNYPLWAALCTVLTYWLMTGNKEVSGARLQSFANRRTHSLARIGIAAVISSASAYLRNGGSLLGAFQEQAGHSFATRRMTYERLVSILQSRKLGSESPEQVRTVAYGLEVACELSALLGCQASRCLDAVGAAHRRMAKLDQAKAAAFATPKATVKLLSALPVLTLAFGSLMGAHPLAFLLEPGAGTICLALGGAAYVVGLLWMRALLKDLDEKVGT